MRRLFFMSMMLIQAAAVLQSQPIIIDFDGRAGGEDYDLGSIDGQSDSWGTWYTTQIEQEGGHDVIVDPNDSENKLLKFGFEEPIISENYWYMYVPNDPSVFTETVYLQIDIMYPDDPGPVNHGTTLAGYFSDPLTNSYSDNQVLFRNPSATLAPYHAFFDARNGGGYENDIEVMAQQFTWYRVNVAASVPDLTYDVIYTDLVTGDEFQIADDYAFRGDIPIAPDEGLAVLASWMNANEERFGRAFIDNIVLSNEPIEVSPPINVIKVVSGKRTIDNPTHYGLEDYIIDGDEVDVTLTFENPFDSDQSIVINESIPAGWSVSEISDGGSESDGEITWELTVPPGSTSVSYKTQAVLGEVSFSGQVSDVAIAGDESLTFIGGPLGIFEAHMDIGNAGLEGEASYDEAEDVYDILASGANIFGEQDQFHYVFREISGNFSIRGRVDIDPLDGDGTWIKTGFMIRDQLTDDSAHFTNAIRTDLQHYTTWRAQNGGDSASTSSNMNPDQMGEIELVRIGDTLEAYYISADTGERILYNSTTDIQLEDPVYIGLALTSHNNDGYANAFFYDVELSVPVVGVRSFEGPNHFGQPVFYQDGDEFTVTLTLNNPANEAKTVDITENVPEGWPVSDVSDGGTESNGQITWSLSTNPGSTSVTYKVTAVHQPDVIPAFEGDVNGNGITGISSLSLLGDAIGLFEGHADIGEVGAPGDASYDADEDIYEIMASGENIFNFEDEFHYIFSEISGDFTLSAQVDIDLFEGHDTWIKTGLMVRNELTPTSAHFMNAMRTDFQQYTTWREQNGGDSASSSSNMNPDQEGELELVKNGNTLEAYYISADTGDRVLYNSTTEIQLENPFFVGLALTSHVDDSYAFAFFENVELTVDETGIGNWSIY